MRAIFRKKKQIIYTKLCSILYPRLCLRLAEAPDRVCHWCLWCLQLAVNNLEGTYFSTYTAIHLHLHSGHTS
jgi:hypothetical protein